MFTTVMLSLFDECEVLSSIGLFPTHVARTCQAGFLQVTPCQFVDGAPGRAGL